MNRRRKVGSTLLLSSVAALAIVGMGLAAATLPAVGNASFGFEWTPAPEEPTPIGTVAATTSMDTVKLVVDEAAKTATMNSSVQFAFTPDETLTGHTFSLTYSFTLPESFDTYFTLTAGEGEQTIQADEPQTYAEGDVTFTIPETALAATLTGDFAEAQTALAVGNITINVTVNDTTGEEPVEPEPSEETATLALTSGWEGFTLSGSVFTTNLEDSALMEILNSSTDSIATSVTGTTSAFSDKTAAGIKLGTGSKPGSFSFVPTKPVKELTIKAVCWSGDMSHIRVGETAETATTQDFRAEGVGTLESAEDFTFTFDTPINSVYIGSGEVGDYRFAIVGLTLTM